MIVECNKVLSKMHNRDAGRAARSGRDVASGFALQLKVYAKGSG